MQPSTKTEWIRCQYFAFWDVPRTWILPWQGKWLLLDSPFEEERDDYRPSYFVWELSEGLAAHNRLSWEALQKQISGRRDDISITAFQFDPTREQVDGQSYVRVRLTDPHLLD